PGDSAHPVIGDAHAPWRAHANAGDRDIAHACLLRGENCEDAIQSVCRRPVDPQDYTSAIARQCDWRAMAAWEDEILAILTDLRARYGGDGLQQLNEDQAAWETSMLADVGLGMDYYSGGSLAGPVGAHIRARATAQRAAFLYEIQRMVDE